MTSYAWPGHYSDITTRLDSRPGDNDAAGWPPPGDRSARAMSMSTTADSAGGQDHAELDAGLVAGVTDRGVRHQRNEDAIALATVYTAQGPVPLAIISDGVSSAPRPDEASLAAVRAAIGVLAESVAAGEEPGAASTAAVRAAASALIKLAGPG